MKNPTYLKCEDKILIIIIKNKLLISDSIENFLPPIFNVWFTSRLVIYNDETVSCSLGKIFKLSHKPDSYGKNSMTVGVKKLLE